jgi:hypothetical protein
MSGDVASLAAEIVPYMSAAASAYGGAVLARVRDDAADATVGLGRRLLQRVFGARAPGEQLPEPLADVVSNPRDEDAVAALRLAVRKALEASPTLTAEVESMLASAGVTGDGIRRTLDFWADDLWDCGHRGPWNLRYGRAASIYAECWCRRPVPGYSFDWSRTRTSYPNFVPAATRRRQYNPGPDL